MSCHLLFSLDAIMSSWVTLFNQTCHGLDTSSRLKFRRKYFVCFSDCTIPCLDYLISLLKEKNTHISILKLIKILALKVIFLITLPFFDMAGISKFWLWNISNDRIIYDEFCKGQSFIDRNGTTGKFYHSLLTMLSSVFAPLLRNRVPLLKHV